MKKIVDTDGLLEQFGIEVEPEPRTWHGHVIHDCPACHFDSIELDLLNKHIKDVHTLPEHLVQPGVITDRFGNILNKGDN